MTDSGIQRQSERILPQRCKRDAVILCKQIDWLIRNAVQPDRKRGFTVQIENADRAVLDIGEGVLLIGMQRRLGLCNLRRAFVEGQLELVCCRVHGNELVLLLFAIEL